MVDAVMVPRLLFSVLFFAWMMLHALSHETRACSEEPLTLPFFPDDSCGATSAFSPCSTSIAAAAASSLIIIALGCSDDFAPEGSIELKSN